MSKYLVLKTFFSIIGKVLFTLVMPSIIIFIVLFYYRAISAKLSASASSAYYFFNLSSIY